MRKTIGMCMPISQSKRSRPMISPRPLNFSILSCSDRVGHGCAPRAHGLWPAGGRIANRLMLGFRVELGADQYHYDRQPNPKHEGDDGAERTVSLVVAAEILRVPRKQYRNDEPTDCRGEAAPCDPAPPRFFATRSITIEKRERQAHDNKQGWPAGDLDHRFGRTAKSYEI